MRKIDHHKNAFDMAKQYQHKKDAFAWVNPVMAGGWFFGTICTFILFNYTLMQLHDVAAIYLVICMLLFAIPYKVAVNYILIRFSHWNLFCFVGLAPLFCGLFLLFNFYLADNTYHAVYKPTYKLNGKHLQTTWVMVPQIPNEPTILRHKLDRLNASGGHIDSMSFSISEGAFMYHVISSHYIHN